MSSSESELRGVIKTMKHLSAPSARYHHEIGFRDCLYKNRACTKIHSYLRVR